MTAKTLSVGQNVFILDGASIREAQVVSSDAKTVCVLQQSRIRFFERKYVFLTEKAAEKAQEGVYNRYNRELKRVAKQLREEQDERPVRV